MAEVVLTADRTVLSEYNDNPFYGFLSCAQYGLVPSWLYWWKLIPRVGCLPSGEVTHATLSLRKVESSLIDEGVSTVVTDAYNIPKVITKETRIVGVSAIDPMGYGPGSRAMRFFSDEKTMSMTSYEFLKLISIINKLKKKYDFKIIGAGCGSWQLLNKKELNIDHIFMGEAEKTFPGIAKRIIKGSKVKKIIKGELLKASEIPGIKKPVIAGMIETARGCGRGCKFCSTTLSGRIRPLSMDKILNDARINIESGRKNLTIQSEDFLSYKCGRNFRPDEDSVYNLFKSLYNAGAQRIRTIHANLASIASSPELMKKLTKLMRRHGQKSGFCQPGIETGSTRLLKKLMPGKLLPFKGEEWSSIVKKAFKTCNSLNWIMCPTVILGMPGEKKEDVHETIRLIKDLKPYKSAIATLFFIPITITSLGKAKEFIMNNMFREHWELLKTCWKHNLHHFRHINLGKNHLTNLIGGFIAKKASEKVIKFADEHLKGSKADGIPNDIILKILNKLPIRDPLDKMIKSLN